MTDFSTKTVVRTERLIGRGGQEITGKDEKIYAKLVVIDGAEHYYIKTYNHEIYNPIGPYSIRERYLSSDFTQVSKKVFDFYNLYLQTNKTLYFTKANRAFIER